MREIRRKMDVGGSMVKKGEENETKRMIGEGVGGNEEEIDKRMKSGTKRASIRGRRGRRKTIEEGGTGFVENFR